MKADSRMASGIQNQRADAASEVSDSGRVRGAASAHPGRTSSEAHAPRRLLIPIDATDRSHWALRYAIAHRDQPLQVDLLFVAEPITNWEVLRFRTQAEIADFQSKCAQWLLDDAAQPLQAAGVTVKGHFREGEVAGQIVEAAEQLGCEAIVMPSPSPRWLGLLSRGTVRKVLRRARATPVIAVDSQGKPVAFEPALSPRH